MMRALSRMLSAIGPRIGGALAAAVFATVSAVALAQSPGPDFDHLTTGYPLTGAHKSAKCETCHVKGIFKGTPKTCDSCHAPGARLSSVLMPTTHAPTTQRCDLCHTTVTFAGARWDHTGVQPGACASCHNGSTATGKPSGHLQTTQSCDVCHRTSAWTPARFDHTGIVADCASCHNGATATGKPATHIPTNQACQTCHTSTTAFSGWTMSHAQIVGGCAACHGGQFPDVVSKPVSHVPTAAPCETCHSSFATFRGATFDHAGIAGQCTTCHNGSTATGMPAGHVPTTQPCELCHSATTFTSFAGATMNHAGISAGCATCHATGSSFFGVAGLKTPPPNHIPTTKACETCHAASNFTSFAGTGMNHSGITSGCATCHAAGLSFFGVTVKAPPVNHIPFNAAACESCHTAGNFASFAGTAMNHAPVAGISCVTCHETGKSFFGVTIVTRPTPAQDPNHPTTGDCSGCHTTTTFSGAVGKPPNHLPTTQPCTLCHSNPNDYSVGTMNHAGISSGCATCHAAGSSFANIVPKAPPPNHIPTTKACETCHAASNFTSFAGTGMNHSGITSGCATCHAAGLSFFGVTVKAPPVNHIPFNAAACESCHTAGNFASFAGTAMNHAPVAGISCVTCHETGKSFFGVTIVTRPTPAQDPNHPTTGDCSGCHTTTTFSGAVGKPPNHLPTTQPCTLCHSNPNDYSVGTMNHAGISSGCATCHAAGSSFANIVPKAPPPNHIPTTKACETCHAASNFTSFAGTGMNHSGITSGCATCHAAGLSFFGVTVKAPPVNHIPFNAAACESCHTAGNFASFAGTAMNHAPVAGISCVTCHETGKSFFGVTIVTRPTPAQDPNHPTTGDCSGCHTTTTFSGAVGKPPNHLPTTQPCTLCHSNPNDYSVGTMNHAGISSGCATCHAAGSSFANIVPKAPPPNHIPTTKACETCHAASNFTSFAGTGMNHSGITSGCATCHAAGLSFFGVTVKAPPVNHIPFNAAACESCHTAGNFASFAGTAMNHAPVAGISCVTCHETGKSFFGVTIVTRPTPAQDPNHPTTGDCSGCHTTTTFSGAVGKPPNHLPTTQPCTLCHSNPNDYSVGTMNHAGISSGCATCHAAGSSFANIVPKAPPPNHIPTTKACETCHAASNFTSFAGTGMNHSGITSGCATCHAAGLSFFGVTVKAPPVNHIPFNAAACESCHTAGNFASFAGTAMNHAPVAGISCVTCHETGKSFFGVTIVTRPTPAQDPNHPTTGDCSGCHTTTTFSGAVGKPPNHLPTTQPCTLCHSNPNDYSVGTMNHAGISSGCATCHAAGSSFANIVPKAPPPNHIPTTKACETCHAASNFTSFAGTGMNHSGITSGCATCHAAGLSFFGVTVKAPPVNHIPFNAAACESCHTAGNFASFAGTAMNHAPVAGISCVTCHETGKSFFGVTIVTRPTPAQDPNHPTTGDCSGCHTTTTFSGAVGKPPNHLPTTQPCTLCHSNPNDYSVGTMNHAGISSGCATCHAAGSSFANIVPKAPPPNHIPTTKACETCHAASNFTSFAGTGMNHSGITSGCATCHAAGLSFFGVTVKAPPVNHIPFNAAACESCHTAGNFASFANTPMNHAAVTGMKCVSCHELGMSWFGVRIVTRPSANHNPGQDCGACHTTTSFDTGDAMTRGARMLRAPAGGTMGQGRQPRGVGPGLGAPLQGQVPRGMQSRDVHIGIAPGSCMSCHNGMSAGAKSARHVVTALSCDSCHRTTTWLPATFTHQGIAPGTCISCHNGALAKSRPAGHFATARSCDSCHRPTSWTTVRYQHVSPLYRAHAPGVSCIACHRTNAETVVWRFAAFKPDCAACHADQFRPQQHPKAAAAGSLNTMVEMRDCAGSCHLGSGPAKAPKTFTSRHRPTDGSF